MAIYKGHISVVCPTKNLYIEIKFLNIYTNLLAPSTGKKEEGYAEAAYRT